MGDSINFFGSEDPRRLRRETSRTRTAGSPSGTRTPQVRTRLGPRLPLARFVQGQKLPQPGINLKHRDLGCLSRLDSRPPQNKNGAIVRASRPKSMCADLVRLSVRPLCGLWREQEPILRLIRSERYRFVGLKSFPLVG